MPQWMREERALLFWLRCSGAEWYSTPGDRSVEPRDDSANFAKMQMFHKKADRTDCHVLGIPRT